MYANTFIEITAYIINNLAEFCIGDNNVVYTRNGWSIDIGPDFILLACNGVFYGLTHESCYRRRVGTTRETIEPAEMFEKIKSIFDRLSGSVA